MADFFDPQGPGANLQNFGFATLAASQQPGVTTLSALGQGGMGMNASALQRAQTQDIQSQSQSRALQNQMNQQMFPLQIQKMRQEMGLLGRVQQMLPGGDTQPASIGASTPWAPTLGNSTSSGTIAKPASGMPQDAATRLAESGGNPYAVSAKGAQGLMQLMPGTQSQPGFGVQPATNDTPEENQRVGTDYLNAMNQRYSDKPNPQLWAQVAYNWGPKNADNWNGNLKTLPSETQNYVKTIDGYMNGGLLNPRNLGQGILQQQQTASPAQTPDPLQPTQQETALPIIGGLLNMPGLSTLNTEEYKSRTAPIVAGLSEAAKQKEIQKGEAFKNQQETQTKTNTMLQNSQDMIGIANDVLKNHPWAANSTTGLEMLQGAQKLNPFAKKDVDEAIAKLNTYGASNLLPSIKQFLQGTGQVRVFEGLNLDKIFNYDPDISLKGNIAKWDVASKQIQLGQQGADNLTKAIQTGQIQGADLLRSPVSPSPANTSAPSMDNVKRPSNIPPGAQYSPSKKQWRVQKANNSFDFFDEAGKSL